MNAFRDNHAALLRRMLLEALEQSPEYAAPISLLRDHLEAHAMVLSMDSIRTALAWLEEQGLAVADQQAAVLTDRGIDVARGHAEVPGVQRRPPGGIIGAGASLLAARLRGEG